MAALLLVLVLALLATGCEGREEPHTPTACREGSDALLSALASAPDEVLLGDGTTRISDCLVRAQPGGQLAEVGGAMVEAATELNAEARRNPGGQANIALGYLLGAAEAAAEDTSGIHTDLIRRLEAAATFSPGGSGLPPQFDEALAKGRKAGAALAED
jgi:hypothetical protein